MNCLHPCECNQWGNLSPCGAADDMFLILWVSLLPHQMHWAPSIGPTALMTYGGGCTQNYKFLQHSTHIQTYGLGKHIPIYIYICVDIPCPKTEGLWQRAGSSALSVPESAKAAFWLCFQILDKQRKTARQLVQNSCSSKCISSLWRQRGSHAGLCVLCIIVIMDLSALRALDKRTAAAATHMCMLLFRTIRMQTQEVGVIWFSLHVFSLKLARTFWERAAPICVGDVTMCLWKQTIARHHVKCMNTQGERRDKQRDTAV